MERELATPGEPTRRRSHACAPMSLDATDRAILSRLDRASQGGVCHRELADGVELAQLATLARLNAMRAAGYVHVPTGLFAITEAGRKALASWGRA